MLYKERWRGFGKIWIQIDEGIINGYSSKSKAYKCYNKRLHKIVESTNAKMDEASPQKENQKTNEHLEETSCKENEE